METRIIAKEEVTDKTVIGMILAEIKAIAKDERSYNYTNGSTVGLKTPWFDENSPFFCMNITEKAYDGEDTYPPEAFYFSDWSDSCQWPMRIEVASYNIAEAFGRGHKCPVCITLEYPE